MIKQKRNVLLKKVKVSEYIFNLILTSISKRNAIKVDSLTPYVTGYSDKEKMVKFKSDFMLGVYGQVIQDGTLQQRNTTNIVVFSLRQGAYFVNALNPGEIEPSAYDLYLAQLQQIFQNGSYGKPALFHNKYVQELCALRRNVQNLVAAVFARLQPADGYNRSVGVL